MLRQVNFKPSFKLRWCCVRDLLRSQTPVITGGFELRISSIRSSCLTHSAKRPNWLKYLNIYQLLPETDSGAGAGGAGSPSPLIPPPPPLFFAMTCIFCNHFGQLQTVLFEVKLIINNAPLTFVYSDTIETCLTPYHLLFGRELLYSSNATSTVVRNLTVLSSTTDKINHKPHQ